MDVIRVGDSNRELNQLLLENHDGEKDDNELLE